MKHRDSENPLSLRETLTLSLLQNPDLAAFSWESRAREADALQAGILPNPELSVDLTVAHPALVTSHDAVVELREEMLSQADAGNQQNILTRYIRIRALAVATLVALFMALSIPLYPAPFDR